MDKAGIVNLALQSFGSRTTVTAAELTANTSNEAKQANLTYVNTRDSLLRMAPWDCGLRVANLTYITSMPGTPENNSETTQLWQPGQPAPGWLYEYQYPVDCLRACWLNPVNPTGISDGVPIFPVATGVTPVFNSGPPVRFKVQTDKFLPVTGLAINAGGTGYAIGNIITVALQPTAVQTQNIIGVFPANQPQGAPAQIRVTNIAGGAVTAAEIVNQINGSDPPVAGSYFYRNTAIATQASTTGTGTGAEFALSFSTTPRAQRVILTNQQWANLAYIHQVEDENLFDPMFQDAFANVLGADLVVALTGDKALANLCIAKTNNIIKEARAADGNEGLTVNDVTPDWIRVRGWTSANQVTGPFATFEWGAFWPSFM